jgi:hypothetical protein
MLTVNHFFPPISPAFLIAPAKKSFSLVSSPFGVQRFDIHGWTRWFRLRFIA